MFWTGQVCQVHLEKENYQQAAGIETISRTVLFCLICLADLDAK